MSKYAGQVLRVSHKYTARTKEVIVQKVFKRYFTALIDGKSIRFNYRPTSKTYEDTMGDYICW